MDIRTLIRPHLLAAAPYSSARDEFQTDAASAAHYVFLDANENPNPGPYNRYPDPHHRALKALLGQRKGIVGESLFLGNGSDEAIDLLLRAVCTPGTDAILTCPPTYGMYGVSARLHDLEVLEVPLTDSFQLDVPAILATATPYTRILFLCSPNNPTGNRMDDAAIETLLRSFPGLVVVDEAYADFASSASWLTRLKDFPNLVVLQTLSKAWGLAGLRIGLAAAQPHLISVLNLLKAPYNISQAAQQAAISILSHTDHSTRLEATIATLNHAREELTATLAALPLVTHVFPSEANFLLVRFTDATAVYQHLLSQHIVVRDRSKQPGCAGCLRITVGTPVENERLVAALNRIGS